jgi:putative resolvase
MQLVPIGVAAQGLGVHPDTLRRWEKEGKIDPPKRTAGGRRRYDLAKLRGSLRRSAR